MSDTLDKILNEWPAGRLQGRSPRRPLAGTSLPWARRGRRNSTWGPSYTLQPVAQPEVLEPPAPPRLSLWGQLMRRVRRLADRWLS